MKSTLGLVGASLFFAQSVFASIVTTLNNSDPIPTFNSSFPYSYLTSNEKDFIKGKLYAKDPNYISFAVSPFYQRADKGKNQCGDSVNTGDLTGRWNMLSLLPYDSNETGMSTNTNTSDIPTSKPNGYPQSIEDIGTCLLDCIDDIGITAPIPKELQSVPGLIGLQTSRELFGFFSVPIEYRKRGVRFSASARIKDVGVSVQTGVAEIYQCPKFYNMMTTTTCGEPCTGDVACVNPLDSVQQSRRPIYLLNPFNTNKVSNTQWGQVIDCVNRNVMNKKDCIARALDIDICEYKHTSVEDVHLEAFWRRLISINTKKCRGGNWPSFIFVPFVSAGWSVAFADEVNQNQIFAISAGNNGHDAFRFNAGFTVDFYNSFELGATAGFTHFKDKEYCDLRVPSNKHQNRMYPFKTKVCYDPGNNWHTSVFMNSYNYSDRFSFWAEYMWAAHSQDKINLLDPRDIRDLSDIDPETGVNKGFKPDVLECKTPWSIQVINTGLTWMASPNFIIGASAQIPIQRRNAYRSTTLAATLELIY